MYQPYLDARADKELMIDRDKFQAIWPSKFTKGQLSNIGENGVIKPGAIVKPGDPLILALTRRPPTAGSALIHGKTDWNADKSVVWDKDYSGVITAANSKDGYHQVSVKTSVPAQVGDKLSSYYGSKGVISAIRKDEEMERDANGLPLEMTLNSHGVISRVNPMIAINAALGKVAAKTGVPELLPLIPDAGMDFVDHALKRLKETGTPEFETLYDPVESRPIPNVFTGVMHTLKLHHTSDAKLDARATGSYTIDNQPSKTGEGGSAKRVGGLEMNGLLAHGVPEVIKDTLLIRGQRNDQFWNDFKLGKAVRAPDSRFIYDKVLNMMRGAGVNVDERPDGTRVTPMTDKHVLAMTGNRVVEHGDALNAKDYSPIEGGLFDKGITGGIDGTHWSRADLTEAMPHPLMEEPIKRLLGLNEQQFRTILGGKDGGEVLRSKLKELDLDARTRVLTSAVTTGTASAKAAAIKSLKFIKGLQETGTDPQDLIVKHVPILPPKFRPVTVAGGMELTSDVNHLYKELFEADKNLKD